MDIHRSKSDPFLQLDSEQITCILQQDGKAVRWKLRSTVTKEIIHSAAMVFNQEKPEAEKTVEVFKERLEYFVTKYFGTHEKLSVRVFNFDSLLEQLQTILKRLRREW